MTGNSIEPRVEWEQRATESPAQYAWLQQYLNLGPQRSAQRTATRCGVPLKIVKEAMAQHDWRMRADAYDNYITKLRTHALDNVDEQLALQAQYEAGRMMMEIGVHGLQSKNANMLKVKQLMDMVFHGAEAMRRGSGVADMKIDHTTTSRIDDLWQDVLGETSD